jgi:hypothetical protein
MVATIATTGLVAGGVAISATAATAAVHKKHAAAPTIRATFGKSGKLVLKGPKQVAAGAVDFKVRSTHGDHELGVFSFKKHYSLKAFKADIVAFGMSMNEQGQPSQSGLKHLRHAIHHVYAYGGFEANPRLTETGALDLKRPTTVYLWNDENGFPTSVHKIKVVPSSSPVALPTTKAHVITTTARRFAGSKVLPAKGTITVTNKSTESPHFLVLQHVAKGTTRKQVLHAIEGNGPPSFARRGEESTNTITRGQSQTLKLNLPKGEYAEMCFFPDPQTGMPHALMGMIRMVHLK